MIFLALSLLPLHARSLCTAAREAVVGGAGAPKIVLHPSVRQSGEERERPCPPVTDATTAGAVMDDETKASHKDDGDFSGCAGTA